MEAKDTTDLERLDISSNLVAAYLINLAKACLLIAAMIGAFYLVQYILGENPFIDLFKTVDIPIVWAMRAVYGLIAAYLLVVIFSTLSLTSYELVFEGDTLKYSYGSIFKVENETKSANIIRTNYKEYSPFKLGEIEIEMTGTEKDKVVVKYVSEAKEQCGLINQLMTLKKSEEMDEVKGKGVEA
ncbi:hypothetical protein ACFL3V_00765 [Nanoarchaeota archaeon]